MATEVLSNFVNGEYVAAAVGQASPVVDPSTGEEYAQAPVSGPADVEAALRAAAGAFEGCGLHQDDEMIQEEIFAPVITVQRFGDESEALRWANGVKYGLAASVWTKNHGRAMRMARRLDFGAVWINTHLPFVSEMPHGGFKHSGYGKDLSEYGFEDYTRIKHVMSYQGG